jgi:aryl-alcohol dehydrogenase-like predicted oxidoreductase
MQLHEVIRFDDPHRFFDRGGALDAFLEAKQAGKIRYIGFTGHKDPEIHLHMLAIARRHGFRFDAAQLPVNPVDAVHSRSFTRRVLPALAEQGIAALAMKSLAGGALLKSGVVTAPECLRFAMSRQVATVITGVDSMERLQQAVKAAAEFRPLDIAEESDLLARTAPAASEDRWELFKTSDRYDSTAKHPAWLGGA